MTASKWYQEEIYIILIVQVKTKSLKNRHYKKDDAGKGVLFPASFSPIWHERKKEGFSGQHDPPVKFVRVGANILTPCPV